MAPTKPIDDISKQPPAPAEKVEERDPLRDTEPPSQQTISDAVAGAVDRDRTLTTLPAAKRLIALLGIERSKDGKPYIEKLPGPYRAISASLPRAKQGAFEHLMQDIGLPCNSDFMGNPDDEMITLNFIVPNADNVKQILTRSKVANIPVNIAVAAESTIIINAEGTSLLSLHSNLEDQSSTPLDSNGQQATQVDVRGAATTIKPAVTSIPTFDISEDADLTNPDPVAIGEDEGNNPTEFIDALANQQSIDFAQNSEVKRPRKGPCAYMMIDQDIFKGQNLDNKTTKALLNELNIYLKSPDFFVTSNNGYIVIVGPAERMGSSFKGMSNGLKPVTTDIKIFIAIGEVDHIGTDGFTIKGFPTVDQRAGMTHLGSDTYVSRQMMEGREKSLDESTYEAVPNSTWYRLKSYRAKAEEERGGPDRMIGNQEQAKALRDAIVDPEQKVVILRGNAGMGKSRLLAEVLGEFPHYTFRFEAAGINEPGAGLVTMAKQLATHTREKIQKMNKAEVTDEIVAAVRDSQEVKDLYTFDQLTQSGKLDFANEDTEKLADTIQAVLFKISTETTPIALDDIHHADSFSLPYLKTIADKYASTANRTAILALRQEDMYDPTEITKLQKKHNATEITVTGQDFSDPEVSRQFAYYSIPESIREGKEIGTWHTELGRIAGRSPYVMKSLMDVVLEDHNNLVVKGNIILLKEDLLTEISNITDINIYYRERIRKLPENAKKVLQHLALMEGKADGPQISKIGKILGIERAELLNIARLLAKGGYINPSKSKDGSETLLFDMQHETMTDIVKESFDTDEEKITSAKAIFEAFKQSSDTNPHTMFAIAHNIASSSLAPKEGDSFWDDYEHFTSSAIQEAIARKDTEKVYAICTTILHETRGCQRVKDTIAKLQTETVQPSTLTKLALTTLLEQARSGVYLAKFKKVGEVAGHVETETVQGKASFVHQPGLLEQIYANNQAACEEADFTPTTLHLTSFLGAYMQDKKAAMRAIYEQKLASDSSLTPAISAIIQIQLAYREGRTDDVKTINARNFQALDDMNAVHMSHNSGMPDPHYADIQRMRLARVPFEALRTKVRTKDGQNIDDDVLLLPISLQPQQKAELSDIDRKLTIIENQRDAFPRLFQGYQPLAILEQRAHHQAFMGELDEAVNSLKEVWRLATAAGIYHEAARAAKLEGDLLVLQAITATTPGPNGQTLPRQGHLRDRLEQAIQTYSKEGGIALAQVDDESDNYHVNIPIQRIRAIGLLCQSYQAQAASAGLVKAQEGPILNQLKMKLQKYIRDAFEDYKKVNAKKGHLVLRLNQMNSEIAGNPNPTPEELALRDRYKAAVGEYTYYISYIGYITDMAKSLSIDVPEEMTDPEQSPLASISAINEGKQFAENLFDNGLNEIQRKQGGLSRQEEQQRARIAA